jgi:signal transduction histidine kinase
MVKKSFRWHLFVRIFLATAAIIYSNRIVAHYVTTHYLEQTIQINIAKSLVTCDSKAGDSQQFLLCAAQQGLGDALGSVSEYVVVCEEKGLGLSPEQTRQCERSTDLLRHKHSEAQPLTDAVAVTEQTVDQEDWVIFTHRSGKDSTRVMIRQADIRQYVESIWSLRDRILVYMAPIVIFMLSLLTLYMTWVVMRPIRSLEESLTHLSSHNLDKPLDLLPPYREFAKFVTVFEQLRERLSQSFLQTRRFAADASHELRTPLTILRGNSERLIAELPTGSEAQVRMRLIGDEIERLIEITEKLLMLSRADANSIRYDMEHVSISTMVTELALDAMAFQPNLQIHNEVEPGIDWICDRSLVQQLLFNLYTNAAKYNLPNGWIRFSLTRRDDRFTLIIENPCDNIPADLQERAFQRFYRGDASRGRRVDGVGLGLSLCSEIARLHKATLNLKVSDRNTVIATLEGQLGTPAI